MGRKKVAKKDRSLRQWRNEDPAAIGSGKDRAVAYGKRVDRSIRKAVIGSGPACTIVHGKENAGVGRGGSVCGRAGRGNCRRSAGGAFSARSRTA